MQGKFEAIFDVEFERGLVDIDFFVRGDVRLDDLIGEAMSFEEAIRDGRTKQVASVD